MGTEEYLFQKREAEGIEKGLSFFLQKNYFNFFFSFKPR